MENHPNEAARTPARAARARRQGNAATNDAGLVREKREQLIAAAIGVFIAKGFHNATVRDIGRAAGMTQGTIYNYVRSKDDILYLVCDRIVSEYQEETRSHQALTYDHAGAIGTRSLRSVQAWAKSELPPGQPLREPAPLFKKLDEGVIEEEYARLEG